MAAAVEAGDEDHAHGAGGRHVDGVMAGAAGHAHVGVAQVVAGLLHALHDQASAVRGLGAAHVGHLGTHAQGGQAGQDFGQQFLGEALQHAGVVAAHFHHHLDQAGHGIGGIGREREPAHGGHHIVGLAIERSGLAVGRIDDARRAHQRVLSDVHGRGACVVGLAVHGEAHAAYAHDVRHHANGQAALLQHRALLYVQLHEGGRAAGAAQRAVQRLGPRADAPHAFGQGFALRVAGGQHGGVQLARQRAAAYAGDAVVAGLLGQEVDHLERVLQGDAVFMQAVRHLDAGQHADDAVEAPAHHHSVAVRAGGDGGAFCAARSGLGSRQAADQIAAFIQMHLHARGRELGAQPGAGLVELGREGAAGPGPVGQGEGGQGLDTAPKALGIDGGQGGHGSR
ncbi:hypothetical protein GY15_18765 [Delftia sp. 670]|nr:hypothetical protein GY15_18765 [Delftia sp. 670]